MPRRRPHTTKNTTRRKPRSSKSGRRRAAHKPYRWWRWRNILVAGLLLGLAYTFYLDVLIRSQFEGRRWAVPAHVYARPLELYPGLPFDADKLLRELHLLAYRQDHKPTRPGSYIRQDQRLVMTTRPFTFWDSQEPARTLVVEFEAGRITRLRDAGRNTELNLARLDPMLIGGIYPAHNEDRILIKLEEAPLLLGKALIAVEDRQFHSHHGIDLRAIARALYANLQAGTTIQGGSTLSQQLVKNFFLSNRRSLWRKLNEALMAILLEWHYDKDEILEAYLNEVYLGQDGERAIHGFALASRFYFDKGLKRLNLPEVATLVALVRGPAYYHPQRHPERLRQRRNLVIEIMAGQGVIDAARARRAKQAALGIIPQAHGALTAHPAFMGLVRRQLRRDYREQDLTSEGLRIFTTLDPLVQQETQKLTVARVKQLDRQRQLHGELQVAAIVTSTTAGEVLALVGDRNPRIAGFNRALDAMRPIGSLVKPAVYLTALLEPQQYNLLTPLNDGPIRLKTPSGDIWTPRNYDGTSHGTVPLYEALVQSYNQATVRLGMTLGFEAIAETLQYLGIEREVPAYPSMLLGALELSPYEVTQMYQTLAAGGFRSPLRTIREVLTQEGKPLRRFPLHVEQAFDPRAIAVLNSALQEVTRSGTARSLQDSLPEGLTMAGKTGTTDGLRDSWFAGFNADYLAVVWLGTDDNRSTGLTGASGALRLWGDIMRRLPGRPQEVLQNEDVETVWIDPATKRLADEDCPGAVRLAFIRGTAPDEYADCAGGGVRDSIEGSVNWFRRLFQ